MSADGVLLLFSMADSKFILYVRKFLKNPLLARKQVVSPIALTQSCLDDRVDPPRDGQRSQEGHQGQTCKGVEGQGRSDFNLWYED